MSLYEKILEIFTKKTFQKCTNKEKILGIFLGGCIFVILIPILIIILSLSVDTYFNLPRFKWRYNSILSFSLISIGLLLIAWTVWTQLKIGKGGPLPIVPTQKLIVVGPYKYCRNPMMLGAILYYFGISFYQHSFSALFFTILFFLLFVLYVKVIEEKELAMRFGGVYLNYKETTPFIIPKVKVKK